MEFKIGDRVEVIDESLSGVVSKVTDKQISFCCADDFEYTYLSHQLIKLNDDGSASHQIQESIYLADEREAEEKNLPEFSIQFKGQKPSFDLHLEYLAPDKYFKLKHNSLLYQLSFVREVIRRAHRGHQRQIVFIHGRGRGVLREELRKMLDAEYPNIEYFDGNYQLYGQGATEVFIHGIGKG